MTFVICFSERWWLECQASRTANSYFPTDEIDMRIVCLFVALYHSQTGSFSELAKVTQILFVTLWSWQSKPIMTDLSRQWGHTTLYLSIPRETALVVYSIFGSKICSAVKIGWPSDFIDSFTTIFPCTYTVCAYLEINIQLSTSKLGQVAQLVPQLNVASETRLILGLSKRPEPEM